MRTIIVLMCCFVFSGGCHRPARRASVPVASQSPVLEVLAVPPKDMAPVEVRGIRFGASEQAVREKEKAEFVDSKKLGAVNTVMYSDSLFGSRVRVAYKFLKNELYSLVYVFTNPGGCSDAKTIYGKLKSEVSDKYGAAATKELDTQDRCLGMAEWNFRSAGRPTVVGLALDGTQYGAELSLRYEDSTRVEAIPAAQSDVDKGKL